MARTFRAGEETSLGMLLQAQAYDVSFQFPEGHMGVLAEDEHQLPVEQGGQRNPVKVARMDEHCRIHDDEMSDHPYDTGVRVVSKIGRPQVATLPLGKLTVIHG